ncbi:Got1 family protein [Purpureocillium lilacinum]|uniref:Got1 family protein n=1 Tax=Purpureocillium lilacinum TaxID=33203 RepID=A0A2U3E7H6_PURLI|nr:Got1 family protein [Purpureocillium lilacinum]
MSARRGAVSWRRGVRVRMFCIVCEGRAELKLRKWLEICLARTLCREGARAAGALSPKASDCETLAGAKVASQAGERASANSTSPCDSQTFHPSNRDPKLSVLCFSAVSHSPSAFPLNRSPNLSSPSRFQHTTANMSMWLSDSQSTPLPPPYLPSTVMRAVASLHEAGPRLNERRRSYTHANLAVDRNRGGLLLWRLAMGNVRSRPSPSSLPRSATQPAETILFLIGLTIIIGPQKTLLFFARKQKAKGTTAFFVGLALILLRWTFIGFLVEAYGIVVLFGDFLGTIAGFARGLPVVGPYIGMLVDRAGLGRRNAELPV